MVATAQQRASRKKENKDASRPKSRRASSKPTEVVASVEWTRVSRTSAKDRNSLRRRLNSVADECLGTLRTAPAGSVFGAVLNAGKIALVKLALRMTWPRQRFVGG
jgi:hypothetical protein